MGSPLGHGSVACIRGEVRSLTVMKQQRVYHVICVFWAKARSLLRRYRRLKLMSFLVGSRWNYLLRCFREGFDNILTTYWRCSNNGLITFCWENPMTIGERCCWSSPWESHRCRRRDCLEMMKWILVEADDRWRGLGDRWWSRWVIVDN